MQTFAFDWQNLFWHFAWIRVFSCRYGDHYEWNKVVTCIHNVLSQQRYLEHYGEVTIRNLKSNVCTCKITFVKVNETTPHKHTHTKLSVANLRLTGLCFGCSLVTGARTRTRTRCRARWWTKAAASSTGSAVCGTKASSATLCPLRNVSGSRVSRRADVWPLLWVFRGRVLHGGSTERLLSPPTDPQPKSALRCYGFSTFAMELNELTPDLKPLLPPSDSRLRPDQRWAGGGGAAVSP